MIRDGIIIASAAFGVARILRDSLGTADRRDVVIEKDNNALLSRMRIAFPRLILMEHCFDGQSTDEFIAWLTGKYRDLRIAVWSVALVQPGAAARFILAGAESFLNLRGDEESNLKCLNRVINGAAYCPAEVNEIVERTDLIPEFGDKPTRREREIIRYTVETKSSREIADILGVKLCTVKMHKANIYKKCNGNTPIDLLKYGLIHRVISVDELSTYGGNHAYTN
jgi:DNA-binding NarL/FixJ family response regulator